MKNLFHRRVIVVVGVIFASLLLFLHIGPSMVKAGDLPEIINIASRGAGSSGHLIDNAISHIVGPYLGTRIVVLPFKKDRAKLESLKNGESFMATVSLASAYPAMRGLEEYSDPGWKPPLQLEVIQHCISVPTVFAVRGDSSDIKSPYDLKGKRVGIVPSWPASRIFTLAHLAFGNLSEDQVQMVPIANYPKSIQAVPDGKVDAVVLALGSPKTFEVASIGAGLNFLPMPKEDKDGWKRFYKKLPYYTYGLWKWKPCKREEGCEAAFGSYFHAVLPDQSEDLVYKVVKALFETYPQYKEVKPPETYFFSLENTLEISKWETTMTAYHPGFIKYAKERGLWTSAHEEYQRKAKEAEKKRLSKNDS